MECKKQIRRRQKLMSEDYKVSVSLAKACKVLDAEFKLLTFCRNKISANLSNLTIKPLSRPGVNRLNLTLE